MAAKTTSIELKGDRVQARSLAEAHVNRLLFDFRKNASFQQLPIYSQTKKFYDQTGAYVGTVYMQTVNGAENIVVHCGAGRKYKEEHLEIERPNMIDQLIPCIIVTKPESYSEEIVGYIVCMSGSFLGPYVYVEKPEDDDKAVIEGFYHEGFQYYVEDLALPGMHQLGIAPDQKTLYYFKPSGLAPDDGRATQSDYEGGFEQTSTCGPVYFADFNDATYSYTVAISENPLSGGGTYGFKHLFDGATMFAANQETVNYSGYHDIRRGDFSITPPDLAAVANYKATEVFSPDCEYSAFNTFKFETFEDSTTLLGQFIDDWANGAIRLNGVLGESAFLHTIETLVARLRAWNDLGVPTPYHTEFSATGYTSTTEDISTELFITVDNGARQSVTAAFGWGTYGYTLSSGNSDLVYHKGDGTASISLASVRCGPYNGISTTYTDMAFIYLGPSVNDFAGSVSFPTEADGADHYLLPSAFGLSDEAIEGKIRGQIFIGIIREQYVEKVKLY